MNDVMFYKSMDNDILVKVYDPGSGTTMASGLTPLKANDTDGAKEKHVPVIEIDGEKVTVSVGSTTHPMTDEHFITCIVLVTDKGIQIVQLTPQSEPKAEFQLNGAQAIKAYEYCNLHGLWVAEA